MPKNVLLIVEGESDEVKFFRRLFGTCLGSVEYHFFPYRTTIHTLAKELEENYPDFEDDEIDIRFLLASLENNLDKKELLLGKYTDVYMIFDFDPHHNKTRFETVKRMLNYFNDSTSQGKLYINYPMMQSYRHFSSLPDPGFKDKTIDYSEIHNYKNLVGCESAFKDLGVYDYALLYSIAVHHVKKANYLVNGTFELPSYEDYIVLNLVKLFDLECSLLNEEMKVSVINTCIFVLIDYNPDKFFRFVESKRSELMI